MKCKKNKLYWLAGLVLLCSIGGVFAYWTQELSVHNKFKTGRYKTDIEEKFISPDNWKPGQETNKDVWVTNNGTIPVFAKVTLHQEWIRRENVTDQNGTIIPPAAGQQFPLFFQTEDGNAYAAQITWGKDVVMLSSGKKSGIDLGLKMVDQIADAQGKWLLVSDLPDQNGDYLLYYIGTIKADEKSPLLVDSVTMNPLIQPAVVRKDTVYDEETKKWITTFEKNSTYDYECARYTMLITATTVQATSDALKEVFDTEADNAEITNYLSAYETNYVRETETLYFEEQNGKMVWKNVAGDETNGFMDFTNMLPGEEYEEQLDIENGSQKTYALYVKAVPLDQGEKADELLERISMKVIRENETLYEGSASGKEYNKTDLQKVIYLGTYKAGEKEQIHVKLKLDSNIGLEYNELLAQNDWKFMVTEITDKENSDGTPGKSQTIHAPQTGDTTSVRGYFILMGCAFILIFIIIRRKRDFT